MWPRAHSLSSRTSTRIIFSPASSFFLVVCTSSSLMRCLASRTRFRKPSAWSMPAPHSKYAANKMKDYHTAQPELAAARRAAPLLHVAPIVPHFGIGDDGHPELVNAFHDFLGEFGELRNFRFGAFEKQFIMDLQ